MVYQLRCRPRFLTVVQNYKFRSECPTSCLPVRRELKSKQDQDIFDTLPYGLAVVHRAKDCFPGYQKRVIIICHQP
ncbi:hypothetical protein TNCV_2649751 [Trichonephila clavipes]|nr:hypothetical protein TNCV_2649751 [Trichonephila clavipes]